MKKILVLGSSGMVGSHFVVQLHNTFTLLTPSHEELDILVKDSIASYIEAQKPEVIVNFAAFTNVNEAEDQTGDKSGMAYRMNAQAVKDLAEVAKEKNILLIQISTEYVFDGTKKGGSYQEDDQRNPINWYGATKAYGEQFLQESGCEYLLVRISMPYTAHFEKKKDIARTFVGLLHDGTAFTAMNDAQITPVLVDTVVDGLKVLIENNARGIYHLGPTDQTTPYDFVHIIAKAFYLDPSHVGPISFEEYNGTRKAKLLQNSTLDVSKFVSEFGEGILQTVEESVEEFARQTKN